MKVFAFGMSLALFSLALCPRAAVAAKPKGKRAKSWVIHAGTLIDGSKKKPRKNVSIVVINGRIEKVVSGFVAPSAGQQKIDLKGFTVLPGLIDLHTHLTVQMSKKSYSERFFMDPADLALRATVFARRTLRAGFTTVRDLGDTANVTISLRKAIAKGWVVGPRIFTAGKSLATTGGHADPTNGRNQKLKGDPGPREGVLNGPSDAAKAVRQRYKDGSDLIKLTATGGVLSLAKSGENPQFTTEELAAVVKTAKDYGMKVAVHAHGSEGMKRAVLAGVDTIEHGTYMTKEVMSLMKRRGTFYVPTISAGKWVAEKADQGDFLPEVVRPKARVIGSQIQKTFARAHKAGVPIAFGTDSGVSRHGDNAQEFIYMVEGGMRPADAIRSATSVAARVLGKERELGQVKAGFAADLIAVRGNPHQDIRVMTKVQFVMKGGAIARRLSTRK